MSKEAARLERAAVLLSTVGIVGFLSSGSALFVGAIDTGTYLAFTLLSLGLYLATAMISRLHERV